MGRYAKAFGIRGAETTSPRPRHAVGPPAWLLRQRMRDSSLWLYPRECVHGIAGGSTAHPFRGENARISRREPLPPGKRLGVPASVCGARRGRGCRTVWATSVRDVETDDRGRENLAVPVDRTVSSRCPCRGRHVAPDPHASHQHPTDDWPAFSAGPERPGRTVASDPTAPSAAPPSGWSGFGEESPWRPRG